MIPISFKSTRGTPQDRRLDSLEDSIIAALDAIKRTFRRGGWFTSGSQITSKYDARPWEILLCNPTAGAFTIILPNPTAADASGSFVAVKNDSASVTAITIKALDGKTIDGFATYTLNTARRNVVFWSNGKEWKEWSRS